MIKKRILPIAGAAILCMNSGGAWAQSSSGDNASADIAGRFYISPLYSFTQPNSRRLSGYGHGYTATVGKQFNDYFDAEIYTFGSRFHAKVQDADGITVHGYGAGVLGFPFGPRDDVWGRWLGGAYGLTRIAYGRGESDFRTLPDAGGTRYILDAGIGYLIRIPYFRFAKLRLETNYRFDYGSRPFAAVKNDADNTKPGFNDLVFSAGLLIPIGAAPPPKDSDGDGVIDKIDECPHTEAGIKVNAVGCPVDSDGDGVTDDLDKCPDTPVGVRVNSMGCPVDSDGDGVSDDKDKCPDTPLGTKVDAVGCPVPLDDDGDGVTNDKDECPGTPAGQSVLANGCTALVLKDVNFESAKAILVPASDLVLDKAAAGLQAAPGIRVEVQGYTDSKGSDSYNQALSQRRAQAVMDYLVSKGGIAKDRLEARGYGEARPVASNDTEAGRLENRRVELKVLGNP